MNALTSREKWDIQKISENENHYPSLPEHRRTAAVSLAAVSACGHHLEYVPETVLDKEICRAALNSKDADCTVLPYIPFPDVQREGVKKFERNTEPFVLYSFIDITDAKTAKEAVNADGYCLQFVPDKLLTEDLCKAAVHNSVVGAKILDIVPFRFLTPAICETAVKLFPYALNYLPKNRRTPELAALDKKEHPQEDKKAPVGLPKNEKKRHRIDKGFGF